MIFVANSDGTPHFTDAYQEYGTYAWFPAELLMLSMNYMYHGRGEVGMNLAARAWNNIVCRWGYAWNQPSVTRGDEDTGEMRGHFPGISEDPNLRYGHENYQNMMLWALPAAIKGEDFSGPVKPSGLVNRILEAAKKQEIYP